MKQITIVGLDLAKDQGGQSAIKWTRCHAVPSLPTRFAFSFTPWVQPRHLRADPGMPAATEAWSPTSLWGKLIKIGAKVVSHSRYVTFQMAEVAVSRQMLHDILRLIARLRAPPAPA